MPAMDDRWNELRRLAHAQHGQLSTGQALDLGFSAWDLRRLAESSQLGHDQVRLLRVVAGEGGSHRALLWAVQLSVRRLVVACAFSAAWLMGLRRRPPAVAWEMVRGKWAPSRPDVRVVTCRTLPDEDIVDDRGLHRTSNPRTIVDLAAHMRPALLRGLLLDARQRGLTDEEEVAVVAERRRGARGRTAVLRLCEQLSVADADSELEAVFRDRVARSPLPPPSPHHLIIPTHGGGTRTIDVAWPERSVGAECDGLAYHGSREAHDVDAVRRTELNLTVVRIVHVTWSRVDVGWPRLERDLSTALAMGGRSAA